LETKLIKKGDFIQVDYTGKLTDEGTVFDTTLNDVALNNGLNPSAKYKPVIICVGDGYILQTLEESLIGKEVGKHTFNLPAEAAFGKKNAKLLKLIPIKVFKKQNIMPHVGLEVNIDNAFGIVRTVSGGRVIVDFNHPLSSKNVTYEVDVKKIVTDDKDKLDAILSISGVHYDSVTVKDGEAMIVLEQEVPDQFKTLIEGQAKIKTTIKSFDYVVKTRSSKTTGAPKQNVLSEAKPASAKPVNQVNTVKQ